MRISEAHQTMLSRDELRRYARHLSLPEVGVAGQVRLRDAKVALIGAGGLGSPLGLYLAAAGTGTIGVVDHDLVESSNLQRQVIHTAADVGTPKVRSASARIAALNPAVRVVPHETQLSSANALDILDQYDVVVDGTDNFPTRYLTNDACVLLGKPLVYGSVYRFEGQASVFDAKAGPCYRCLFPEPPPPGAVPSCEEGGVLGVLPGLIGMIQAVETVKLVVGIGEPLIGRLLTFDALEMRFRELKLRKDPDCPVCGRRPTITALIDYEAFCGIAPRTAEGNGTMAGESADLHPVELKAKMDRGDRFELVDVREKHELDICALPYTKWIPIGDFAAHIGELDPESEIVVYCRSGARSGKAASMLRQRGFKRARNLLGGVLAWSDDVDPSMEKY